MPKIVILERSNEIIKMISKNDLQKMMQEEVKGKTDHLSQLNAVINQIKFASEHYNELDVEAKEMTDGQFSLLKQFNDVAAESVKQQPDSKLKREFIRLHRQTKGSHFNIEQLLAQLEKEPKSSEQFAQEAQKLFNIIAQTLLNYLCDITENRLKGGGKNIVQLGLFYSALEESYVALHLAKHSLVPQSMSHTRHVLETVDLVTLFHQDPKNLDYWTSDNYREREKLLPKNVRIKIGKKSYDEIYGRLSNIGTHSSFEYIKTKMKIRINPENKILNVKINLGGSLDQSQKMGAYVVCILSLSLLLTKLVGIFGSYLLKEDAEKELKDILRKENEFMSKYRIPEI